MNIENTILHGDAKEKLKEIFDNSIDMCMTSPPYWQLRDYGKENQLGLESDFNEYIDKLCSVFDEVWRVLKNNGTCWVNIGDSYAGSCGPGSDLDRLAKKGMEVLNNYSRNNVYGIRNKSLCMIPQRFAIEMISRGWILRNVIIWHKPNCLPSSVKDRFTVDFEYLYFFSKNQNYYFKQQFENIKYDSLKRKRRGNNENKNSHMQTINASRENIGYDDIEEEWDNHQGRNRRTVWSINTKGCKELHYAVYPEELCIISIDAGCPDGGIVLDPFMGAGTTGVAALKLGVNFIGIELNEDYIEIANKRIRPFLEQAKLF
jgi:site-specific DNA-methyltransferase (adenine-specific)